VKEKAPETSFPWIENNQSQRRKKRGREARRRQSSDVIKRKETHHNGRIRGKRRKLDRGQGEFLCYLSPVSPQRRGNGGRKKEGGGTTCRKRGSEAPLYFHSAYCRPAPVPAFGKKKRKQTPLPPSFPAVALFPNELTRKGGFPPFKVRCFSPIYSAANRKEEREGSPLKTRRGLICGSSILERERPSAIKLLKKKKQPDLGTRLFPQAIPTAEKGVRSHLRCRITNGREKVDASNWKNLIFELEYGKRRKKKKGSETWPSPMKGWPAVLREERRKKKKRV